jgi:hypothetical protein
VRSQSTDQPVGRSPSAHTASIPSSARLSWQAHRGVRV